MVINRRRDELEKICKHCKAPIRHPACQDHCETGIELKAIREQERAERNERKKAENENRSYIRDAKERTRRKRGRQ